jgi:hypothetical protein
MYSRYRFSKHPVHCRSVPLPPFSLPTCLLPTLPTLSHFWLFTIAVSQFVTALLPNSLPPYHYFSASLAHRPMICHCLFLLQYRHCPTASWLHCPAGPLPGCPTAPLKCPSILIATFSRISNYPPYNALLPPPPPIKRPISPPPRPALASALFHLNVLYCPVKINGFECVVNQ